VTTTIPTPTIDGPRERVVQAASRLLRTRGYAGTSLRDIVKAADAPWGSLQHYFPGGKDQIVVEAMAFGARQVEEAIEESFRRTRSAEGAVRWFFARSAEAMEEREFDAGCPVALVALERAGDEDEVARYSRERLADWQARFAKGLADDGIARPTARRLAAAIINQYEGALILSRVGREIEPLQAAGTVMHQLVAEAH
jgi:AcrR family transcriptional regulator